MRKANQPSTPGSSEEALENIEVLLVGGAMNRKDAILAAYQLGVIDGKINLAVTVGKKLAEVE